MIEQIPEELHGAMLKEFKTGWNFQKVMAEAQTQQVGQVNQMRAKSIDGIGQLQMRVNTDSFHFWGQKLGYDCWKDKAFRKRYMEKNDYCKVNSGGTKEIHVGYSSTRTPKHRKVYA